MIIDELVVSSFYCARLSERHFAIAIDHVFLALTFYLDYLIRSLLGD